MKPSRAFDIVKLLLAGRGAPVCSCFFFSSVFFAFSFRCCWLVGWLVGFVAVLVLLLSLLLLLPVVNTGLLCYLSGNSVAILDDNTRHFKVRLQIFPRVASPVSGVCPL